MPFSEFIRSYAPDQLAKLTEAFDLTWPELLLAYRAKTPAQLEGMRRALASYILSCAKRGEFDPITIKKHAVRFMSNRAMINSASSISR